jgi:hypothetical protein
MNFGQKKTSKTILLLALTLTVSLIAGAHLSQTDAQTAPSVIINNGATYTNSITVLLTLSSTNATQMRFSNDNTSFSDWETYVTTKTWILPSTEGVCTIYVQFQDNLSQTTTTIASITLDITPPEIVPYIVPYSTDYKTVYFDSTQSSDNSGSIQNSTWNFGDGNTTNGFALLHSYSAIGTYNITLTLRDWANNTASTSFNITIPDLNNLPTATPKPTAEPTAQPTITQQPTATGTPAPTAAPTRLDSTIAIVLIAAVAIIFVVVMVVIVMLKRKPKPAAPAYPQKQENKETPSEFTI